MQRAERLIVTESERFNDKVLLEYICFQWSLASVVLELCGSGR